MKVRRRRERRVVAVLRPVVIYCYTGPVHSCIDNHSYHSKTESDESARNATYINNEERECSSRGTSLSAGWKGCSASVRIQNTTAVPSSLHSFVNVSPADAERMESVKLNDPIIGLP